MRVGSAADWCVSGEGVQALHLSLLYDGTDLFVAAVSPTVYVSLNGQPVAANQWIPAGVSSEICFGSAVLHVARGESQPPGASPSQFPPVANPATAILPSPIPAPPLGPDATLSDGGRLRELAQQAREQAGLLPSSPPPPVSPSGAPPPAVLPTPVPAAGNPAVPAAAPPAGKSAPPPPAAAKGSSWGETSLVKKITLFLLPLAAVGTWLTWDEPEPTPRKAKRKVPAASASVLAAGPSARPKNGPSPSGAIAPAKQSPASTVSASSSGVAVPSAAAPIAAPPTTSAAPLAAKADDPKAAASAGVLMLAPGSSDTTPRAAIDAAFAGRLETAKELYAKLVAAYPDKPEFALAKQRVEENAVRKP
jgi:hypothetical protein